MRHPSNGNSQGGDYSNPVHSISSPDTKPSPDLPTDKLDSGSKRSSSIQQKYAAPISKSALAPENVDTQKSYLMTHEMHIAYIKKNFARSFHEHEHK